MQFLKQFLLKVEPFLPECLRDFIYFLFNIKLSLKGSRQIKSFLSKYSLKTQNIPDDEMDVIKHLQSLKLSKNLFNCCTFMSLMYPYKWVSEYTSVKICVRKDTNGRYFIESDGKKLYPKFNYTKKKTKRFAKTTGIEMDVRSPHRYVTHENYLFGTVDPPNAKLSFGENFYVKPGDIVADIGCADGNFALSIVDTASHVYLFEYNPEWLEALEETFKPYKDKVTIVNKYVSNHDSANTVKLDTYFKNKEVNFIKADVDYTEADMLMGAKQLMQNRNNIKFSICTYHYLEDASTFRTLFENLGYHVSFTRGFVFLNGSLRKAVIRAYRQLI